MTKQEIKKNCIFNIMRWLLFGIIIIVIPSLCKAWYSIIVGIDINIYSYIPDIAISVLSVSCNLINLCIDTSKFISYLLRWILCLIFGIISIICLGLFFVVHFTSIDLKLLSYYENNAKMLIYTASIIILLCAIIGFIIELYTAKKAKI